MKKLVFQVAIIAAISIVAAVVYNQFSPSPLPLIKKYDALEAADTGAPEDSDSTKIEIHEIDMEIMNYMLESGEAVLLDARTKEDFQLGHIPGAVNLPVYQFESEYDTALSGLEKAKTIIAYCSSYTCLDSSLLARKLYRKGHSDILVYKGGYQEWQELGNPITVPGQEVE